MRIVYVGDNRHRENFGCRATSTALSQLIEQDHEIVGTIYGDYTNFNPGNLFFYQHYPQWVYKKVGALKPNHRDLIKQLFYAKNRIINHGRYFFGPHDFIGYNLNRSIRNLIKLIPANPELQPYDLRQYDFDAMVVNGEGSFIFATPPWRECMIEMMLMYWAQKMGKKVFFLNSMLSDDPYSQHNEATVNLANAIFCKATMLGVRENLSFEYAKRYFPQANTQLFPDALFTWYDIINDDFTIKNGKYFTSIKGATNQSFNELDFTQKYILISGSSSALTAAKNNTSVVVSAYQQLTNATREAFPEHKVFLIQVCEGDLFLNEVGERTKTPVIASDTPIIAAGKILAGSDLFISGRYHPAILASLGGTPCVFMGSNSHKTRSVQELLEYKNIKEYNVLPDKAECDKIIANAKAKLEQGEKLRQQIKNTCKLLSQKAASQKNLIR